jgi:23S rRNA (uridine2552-2'-O)-methyltransferase
VTPPKAPPKAPPEGKSAPGSRAVPASKATGQDGGRALKVRVKTARKRSVASAKWLERQLNDPYVARARRDGWRSRAAYKLIEMDDKYRLFRPGQRVVDLGAAPGGWSQVAARKVGSAEGRGQAGRLGQVVGIDLLPIEPIAGVDFVSLDFLADDAAERLAARLGGPADMVMSDMAANATGHKKTDHLRIVALAEAAIAFARQVLAPGGTFLAKVLQGGTETALLADLKRDFATVRHVKPAASRAESAELYVLATGFRGRPRTGPAKMAGTS